MCIALGLDFFSFFVCLYVEYRFRKNKNRIDENEKKYYSNKSDEISFYCQAFWYLYKLFSKISCLFLRRIWNAIGPI